MRKNQQMNEIFAEFQINLPDKVNKIKSRLTNIKGLANKLRSEGLIKNISYDEENKVFFHTDKLEVIGISSKVNTIPAFGGVLYSINTLGYYLSLVNKEILYYDSYALFKIGDVDSSNYREILLWKQYIQTYELIETVLDSIKDLKLVIIELPFLIRRVEQLVVQSSTTINEFKRLKESLTSFWKRNMHKLYPYNREGVILCSLSRNTNSNILHALKNNELVNSCEEISPNLIELLRKNINIFDNYGFPSFIYHSLNEKQRTISYSYSDLKYDLRAEPKLLLKDINGLFLKLKKEGKIHHLEFIGSKENWTEKKINELSSKIIEMTWVSGKDSLPVPLWYARKLNKGSKSLLYLFKKEIKKGMGKN